VIEFVSRPQQTVFRIYLPLDARNGGGKATPGATAGTTTQEIKND